MASSSGAKRSRSQPNPQQKARQRRDEAPAQQRGAALRFLDSVGGTEILIFGATIAVGIWAWLAFVTVPEDSQNVSLFGITFIVVSFAGALLQMIMLCYVRRPGSLRERLMSPTASRFKGGGAVFWAPPVVFALAFLAVTPPSTSAAAFESGWSIYQAIGLMVMMCVVFTVLGAITVFIAVVVPLGLLVGSILPVSETTQEESVADPISRSEAVYFALIVLSAIGFGVSMPAVTATAGAPKYEAMAAQLIALVTFQGQLLPSILAYVFIGCVVVLALLARRATRRRNDTEMDGLRRTPSR